MIHIQLLPVTVTSNIISSDVIFSNYIEGEKSGYVMPLSLIDASHFGFRYFRRSIPQNRHQTYGLSVFGH